MANKLDFIPVIDLESTCWEGDPPDGQLSEIIEIGIALVGVGDWAVVEKESILVVPTESKVSQFCTDLTTLTQEQLERDGVSFEEALDQLQNYKTKHRTWASYGDYDRRMFQRQCVRRELPYPFGPTHINVKNLFALKYRLDKEVGMAEALRLLRLPLDGTHHRGVDDSCNIAKMLKWCIT